MGNNSRHPGFWAEVGVQYDVEYFGPSKYWRARLPGNTAITAHGRTKTQALAGLKSAHAHAHRREHPSAADRTHSLVRQLRQGTD